jgi:hypothetical protein
LVRWGKKTHYGFFSALHRRQPQEALPKPATGPEVATGEHLVAGRLPGIMSSERDRWPESFANLRQALAPRAASVGRLSLRQALGAPLGEAGL